MYSGMVIGTILGCCFVVSHRWPLTPFLIAQLVLILPTAFQPWFQHRRFKIVARTLLGVAVATFAIGEAGGLDAGRRSTWVRIALVAVFFAVYRLLTALRQRRPNDPCDTCPLGRFPVCEWNLPRLLGATSDPLLKQIGDPKLISIVPAD